MSLLLLFGGGSTSIASFTLSDTISLSATEGTFDEIDLDCEDLTSISEVDAITESPLLNEGDSIGLHLAESITATVSTGSVAQSLSDTVSLTLTETLADAIAGTVTETASLTLTDAISNNAISAQALADTISLSTADLLSADIGVPIELDVEYDDTINLLVLDVLSASITEEVQIEHITFRPLPDHITFQIL